MKKFLLALFILLIPSVLQAETTNGPMVLMTTTDTGIGESGAENLSDSPTTSTINMLDRRTANMVSLKVSGTWGTSTYFVVTCEGSLDTVEWAKTSYCPPIAAPTCEQDRRTYSQVDSESAIAWWVDIPTNYPYIRCTFTDTGTGTISVTGTRAQQ